ncbi:MAG: hypothetical protein ACW991_09085, partial [Candidatus Hodarchaeales archaeon]
VFGETYYLRYPIDVGTKEAVSYRQSIFKGDDSQHAWDASAVRQKIIARLIESHERKIRKWYGELSYFADSIKFLLPLPEVELDFILRTSLHTKETQPYLEARNNLLKNLDPDLTEKPIIIFEEEYEGPEDRAIKFGKCQIELFGLFNIIKDRLFILTDTEILEILDLLLDVNSTDKFLVKRFVKPSLENTKPFIGQGNREITLPSNFLLKHIGGGDEEFYKRRVFQLWLKNLLDFDKKASDYILEKKADLFSEFDDVEVIKRVLLQAIKLHKLISVKERFLSLLKNEYARRKDFSGYKGELIHLLQSREEFFSGIESDSPFSGLIDHPQYTPRYICHELGVTMIESVLSYLSQQIPEPEGVGGKIQSRMLLNKRISSMKKYVITDEIRNAILKSVSNAYETLGTENQEEKFADIIREPYNRLMPRGEQYFQEMEAEVRIMLQESEDRDLRKELAATTDTPQSLSRQYGKKAMGMLEEEINLEELYSMILSLKYTELMFSGETLTSLKRQGIAQSLIDDLISPQFDFIRLVREESELKRQMEK